MDQTHMIILELKERSGLAVNRAGSREEHRAATRELHGLSLAGAYSHSKFTTKNETMHCCDLST